MKVTRTEVVELFSELGVPTASRWSEVKCMAKLNQLPHLEGDPASPELQALRTNLVQALQRGDEVTITGWDSPETPKEAPAPKAAKNRNVRNARASKTAPAPKPAKASKSDHAAKNGHGAKNGKPHHKSAAPAGKHPGIWRTIVDVLRKGSEEKPVTKAQILAVLAKKFPDRDLQGMKRTVSGLRTKLPLEKGVPLKVAEGGKAFWCPPAPAGCRY